MIEDDPELAEIITKYLAKFDIDVTNAEDPYIGLSKLEIGDYELLILDLTLPGMDGLELLQRIRKVSDIPVIISSARDDIVDKVVGLERGADDYLPKPYNPRELEARIKSILRRHNRVEEKKAEQEKIFEVNEDGMMITFKGEPLSLTPAEFDILNALIKHKNGVVSRADIIYQSDFISDDSSYKNVDVMVSKIRSKIARHDPDHAYIKSVRGVGYQLLCPPQKNS
ncbi:MAG: DNA-binding response regulator [Sulfurospirillum sp.]|nr:MAG: DNA-binding response regulator [Sulfurospirillum sp.]